MADLSVHLRSFCSEVNDDDIERLSDEEDPLSIVESQRDDVETSKADDVNEKSRIPFYFPAP